MIVDILARANKIQKSLKQGGSASQDDHVVVRSYLIYLYIIFADYGIGPFVMAGGMA